MLKSMRISVFSWKQPTLIHPADDAKNIPEESVARGSPGESCATSSGSANVQEDDIVIAVMGPTGSGKSTFVRFASGQDASRVGHRLTSCTDKVTVVRFQDQASGRHVVLVDTPGFDDTLRPDIVILSMISEWLASSYSQGKLLSGILWLHRITDNRMSGTRLKDLRVFTRLCGKEALDKVYLTTTMWDEVDESVGEGRLKELKTEYWKSMIKNGAQIARCRDKYSAKSLLEQIILADKSKENDVTQAEIQKRRLSVEACQPCLPSAGKQFQTGKVSEETGLSKVTTASNSKEEITRVLLIQKEMVDRKKELKETAAGQELYSQLEALAEKQTVVLRKLVSEIEKTAKNEIVLAELRKTHDELQSQIENKMRQMRELRLPWHKRVLSRI